MKKISGPKGALLVGAIAAGLTGCGGGGNGEVNKAPEIKGVPSSLSMPEETKKVVENIVCIDPNGDRVELNVSSSNPNLVVSYNEANKSLILDATTWNLADGVNEKVNVTLNCRDGKLNDIKEMNVTVQDAINDALLTYTTNIPSEVSYKGDLNGSITLSDRDGLASTEYTFDLIDSEGNIVYTGVMEDTDGDGTYEFSIDLSSLNLNPGTCTFQTESISPVIGGENPQGDINITKNVEVKNYAPEWTQSSYDTGLTIKDNNDDPKTIMDLTSVSSDTDGDSISYSIVSISVPDSADQSAWDNATYIENGVLKVKNLVTLDPNYDGTVTVTVKASDGTNSSNTTISFAFQDTQ